MPDPLSLRRFAGEHLGDPCLDRWPALQDLGGGQCMLLRIAGLSTRQVIAHPADIQCKAAKAASRAASRSRERMMKESMYSASKLRSRLSAKDEDVSFSVAAE